MRSIYTLLFYLLIPFVLLRLYWRGIKAPQYRKRWLERLGFYHQSFNQGVIWIHAVSVGEAEAVFPLVKSLQQQYSNKAFLVTCTTPTGSARIQAVLADTVQHVYLPYDLPGVVQRFLTAFKPDMAVFMEKEIWPNLYSACKDKQIPLMIINARLSANSAKSYKKIPALVKPALAAVSWIGTQTKEDKQRFIEIGANQSAISVTGNLKFDLQIDNSIAEKAEQIKKQLFVNRFVWIIASTHENEEAIFFDLYAQLKQQIPELILLVVPRHPERFAVVKQLAEKKQLETSMRTSSDSCSEQTDVYIADTMGELKLLYATADICFVGGSMVPVGGHNILEPAALGVPILFGPHMVNFKEIANNVLSLQAAIQCQTPEQIVSCVLRLYADHDFRDGLADRAEKFIRSNQGATNATRKLIGRFISQ